MRNHIKPTGGARRHALIPGPNPQTSLKRSQLDSIFARPSPKGASAAKVVAALPLPKPLQASPPACRFPAASAALSLSLLV